MNYHISVSVDSKGTLTLPKEWIEKNLTDEGKVALYEEGDQLIIRPVREIDDDFFETKDLGLLALRR